ncbi:glycosyltransferase involved in cell wall biosynthesis [Spirilliplanes yamanashiensis]|nr:glycosyltransferase involved in cell wall biosynthesis [Spirilliplanes yamanashiensis]
MPETHEHVTRVATELSVRGHDVRLYEPEGNASGGSFTVERVPVEAPSAAPVSRLTSHVASFGRWLADRWTREWRPDVVHGHFWVGGLAAATAVRSTSIPVVQTFHSLAAEQRRHLGSAYAGPGERATLERALGRAVDQAVAYSGDEADELTRMGLPRANVTVVPPGVDTELFHPEGDAQPRAGRPRILAVGLDAGHGQDDVIRALRLVADAELVVVGRGARHAEARRLQELAASVGLGDRVRIVDGVAEHELPAWYRSADVVACAPAHSGAARVALEAMACAVPVVGYAVGPTGECVVDKVTGRLVTPGDVRELGNGLRRLTTDGTERFAYANAAVDRVRVRYTWERTAAGLERVYERAVDSRRAA